MGFKYEVKVNIALKKCYCKKEENNSDRNIPDINLTFARLLHNAEDQTPKGKEICYARL